MQKSSLSSPDKSRSTGVCSHLYLSHRMRPEWFIAADILKFLRTESPFPFSLLMNQAKNKNRTQKNRKPHMTLRGRSNAQSGSRPAHPSCSPPEAPLPPHPLPPLSPSPPALSPLWPPDQPYSEGKSEPLLKLSSLKTKATPGTFGCFHWQSAGPCSLRLSRRTVKRWWRLCFSLRPHHQHLPDSDLWILSHKYSPICSCMPRWELAISAAFVTKLLSELLAFRWCVCVSSCI